MSFWLFLRIMIGLFTGKVFLGKILDNDKDYYFSTYLFVIVFRIALAFISWWGLTPLLDLL